ncbi:RagB/SusD family nutrient uptake outer membrane protein [Sphingobacterium sp.]|uniref:RagB/SusD family nutrient uptake outer membrane protein n=1 Tax=Sphingobacterium sp. TaxID=341027 RepID=UPI00289D6055|nr:RagB/SusD family nutrient uptake outer membrane protein [Sphingobacterium sp.]
MTKKLFQFVCLIFLIAILPSCSKWLAVEPEDKFTEDRIYSSPQGFVDGLNGIYLKMANNSLYGRNLTLTVLDMFAQRYYQNGTSYAAYQYATYSVNDVSVKSTLESIWDNMYLTIANTNQFIRNVDRYGHILTNVQKDQYKGEALGLRAFLYFDLLRMYGPIYNSIDSIAPSIPFQKELTADVSPYLPANELLQHILDDIKQAEALLAFDPVLIEGRANNNAYRLNLLALKALKARVLLWRGSQEDKQLAYITAKEVIASQSLFPWVTHQAITGSAVDADRIFSTEVLFNIYVPELYTIYDQLYNPLLGDQSILSTGPSNQVETLYEGNQADYRFNYSWTTPGAGVGYKTFLKYVDVSDKDLSFRNTIPLIRMSEMYYIAAETAANPTDGLYYLNQVRRARGLASDITEVSALTSEITKEYIKEFFGEGQLWYYYKRKAIKTVASPNSTTGTYDIRVFQLPLPDSETSVR